jgi:hypothetical protein
MGLDRSMAKVAEQMGKASGYKRQLEEWSSYYKWAERARAYDEEQLNRRRKMRQNALDKLYDKLAKVCSEELEKTWKDIDKLRNSKNGLGSIASVNLAKLLIDTQIQVLGGNEKQKVELTGKDGGKIEMETVVETFWGRGTDPRRKERTEVEEPSPQIEEEAEGSAEFGIDIPEDEEEG